MLPHNQTHKLNCFWHTSNPLDAVDVTETLRNQLRYRCLAPVLSWPSRCSSPSALRHCSNSWCRSGLTPCLSRLDGAKQRGWPRPPWRLRVTSPHFLPRKLRRWRGFLLLPSRTERGRAREDSEEKMSSPTESLGAGVLLFSGSSWQQSVTKKLYCNIRPGKVSDCVCC